MRFLFICSRIIHQTTGLINNFELLLLYIFIEQETICESGSFSDLRLNKDISVELVDNLLADEQA